MLADLYCKNLTYVQFLSTVITAAMQVQVGKEVPDVDIAGVGRAFEVTQSLLRQRTISAGHDISDGGIITTLLEMAFAGNCGITVSDLLAHDLRFTFVMPADPGQMLDRTGQ